MSDTLGTSSSDWTGSPSVRPPKGNHGKNMGGSGRHAAPHYLSPRTRYPRPPAEPDPAVRPGQRSRAGELWRHYRDLPVINSRKKTDGRGAHCPPSNPPGHFMPPRVQLQRP